MSGIVSCGSVCAEEPESFEAFKREVGDAQQRIDYSKHLLRHDELHKFIPEPEKLGEPEPVSVKEGLSGQDSPEASGSVQPLSADPSGKPDNAPVGEEATPTNTEAAQSKEAPQKEGVSKDRPPSSASSGRGASKAFYIAPSLRRSGGGNTVNNMAAVDQPEVKSIIFGIRIGTEIEVELVGGASNVQNGQMKFRVTRTVTGDKRSLPLNTLLFARPSAVLGSPRLFMSQTLRGITPDGKEFMLKASIRADDRQPGLMAYVVNDGKTLYRAASEGKTALAENLLSLAPDGVIVDAGKAAAGQVLQEQQGESQAKYGSGVYVVQANPQPAIIEIEETF
jgi:hypothetical protein